MLVTKLLRLTRFNSSKVRLSQSQWVEKVCSLLTFNLPKKSYSRNVRIIILTFLKRRNLLRFLLNKFWITNFFHLYKIQECAWIDLTEVPASQFEININGLVYQTSYQFRISATTSSGRTNWVSLGPVMCVSEVDKPVFKLPRALKKGVKIRCGRKLHLKIPFEAGPNCEIDWKKKEDNQCLSNLESHVKVHTGMFLYLSTNCHIIR